MARPESVLKAGYYPIPAHLLPAIAGLVEAPPRRQHFGNPEPLICDPCAGEGDAVAGLLAAWGVRVDVAAVELEAGRHAALKRRHWGALHGDAFQVVAETGSGDYKAGADLLLLNPPYDVDRDHERLEERFLLRTRAWLHPGGAIIFVLPHYALAASAATLARSFEDLRGYRFPSDDFAAFRQVVVVGRRRVDLPYPDAAVEAELRRWASTPELLPELPGEDEVVAPLPVSYARCPGFLRFEMADLDLGGLLARVRPWEARLRGGLRLERACTPELDEGDLLTRSYPLADAPRAAHMAAALAAGVFNGARVEPDDGNGRVLLVKGTFTRDWHKVDEKRDKEGRVTAHVEVQQPRLTTTVLDLGAGTYHTLAPSGVVTGAEDPAAMTTADLLDRYGQGLMGAMLRQCPVVDAAPLELPPLLRTLYPAQHEAVRTIVHLLRHGDAAEGLRTGAIVQGEVGTGKTTVALAALAALGARNPLVLVPPHLVSTWAEQARAVLPEVDVRVLSTVTDVRDLPRGTAARPVLAVLSRETAKLGHGLATVTGPGCPRCSVPLAPGRDYARLRERCQHRPETPANPEARRLLEVVDRAAAVLPSNAHVQVRYPRTPARARALAAWEQRPRQDSPELRAELRRLAEDTLALYRRESTLGWVRGLHRLPQGWGDDVRVALAAVGLVDAAALDWQAQTAKVVDGHQSERLPALRQLLRRLAWALAEPVLVERIVAALVEDRSWQSYQGRAVDIAAELLLMDRPTGQEIAARAARHARAWHSSGNMAPWSWWPDLARRIAGELPTDPKRHARSDVTWTDTATALLGVEAGSLQAVAAVLDVLAEQAAWTVGEPCGEPLYQAIPEPRRYPLAKWISRRRRGLFDLLVIDEGHEYATSGSAQQVAAERLVNLRVPTLLLSGTLSNGYARSLFTNLHALSDRFRRIFDREDTGRFVERYGYLKRTVSHVDGKGKVIEWGSQSDRVQRQERAAGQAPGVLPLLQLRWLGPMAVTLQLDDLGVDLPPVELLPVELDMGEALGASAGRLLREVKRAVQRDRFDPLLVGKLWGAMARLPLYPDLAASDAGNVERDGERAYEVRYPESVGGALVEAGDLFPAADLLPKESWVVDTVRAELGEDRPVLVYAHSSVLVPRLAGLLAEHLGVKVAVLDPAKVGTAKRDDWIRREVVGRGVQVLVTNAACVQTGLNSLVAFSTIVWAQNPECNPTVFAQANGRIHRVGQTRPCRIHFPMYRGLQASAHRLLLHKVGVARAVDGMDPEAALRAAGIVDDDSFTGFSVGRALYEIVTREGVQR